jgi:hypothetical protein
MADVIGAIRKAVKLFEADLRDEAREVWIPRQKLEITLTTNR